MIRYGSLELEWLGYATLRITGEDTTVYLDPGRYGVLDEYNARDGDVVCVTHNHHYDSDGIRRVAGEDATLVVFQGVNTHTIDRDVERPADLPFDICEVDDEADIALGGAVIRTTAAYNLPDGPHVGSDGDPYHPQGFGCGFHVTVDGTGVFWPGDTDVLEGHAELDVDVFSPPIGGTFTMDRHEAAALAGAMDPRLVIPIHYDTFEAIETDAEAFAADVASQGVPVALDEAHTD